VYDRPTTLQEADLRQVSDFTALWLGMQQLKNYRHWSSFAKIIMKITVHFLWPG